MNTNLTYEEIYKVDIELMEMITEIYGSFEKAWDLFYEFYTDPDGYPLEKGGYKMVGDVKCTVDGLLSVKRMRQHEGGFSKQFIQTFERYRRTPIIFFPAEMNGINMSRASVFGDKIDPTLYDIKRKCEQVKEKREKGHSDITCKLECAYKLPITTAWFEAFNYDFAEIVKCLGIEDVFVVLIDGKYEVIDLEKNDGSIITNYADSYTREWSPQYYENIKSKIEQFEEKHS